MAGPVTPVVTSAGPIPPPVLQLPWGTVGPGGSVTLTSSALEFLQLLWSRIQGQGGLIDELLIALPVGGEFAGLSAYVDNLVPLLMPPPVPYPQPAAATGVTFQVVASEAIADNSLVNVWSDSGAFHVRQADSAAAIGDLHECSGFVNGGGAMGDTITLQFSGKITGLSALTPGPAYMGPTGAVTSTPNSTSGETNQQIGIAVAADTVVFQPMPVQGL